MSNGNDMWGGSDGSSIPSAQEERFRALQIPDIRDYYEEAASRAGFKLSEQYNLTPLVVSQCTQIYTNTATNPTIEISLNADVPRQVMRFYFQDPAFIRRVTTTIIAPVIHPAGVPGVQGPFLNGGGQPYENFTPTELDCWCFEGVSPEDYLYAQFERDGAGQIFQTQMVPLSEIAGNAAHGYFFNLIPFVKAGGSLVVTLSIMPPGNQSFDHPPFVSRIGLVTLSFHCERVNLFGV